MLTAINANIVVKRPRVAVIVRHLTDARKFVVTVTTKKIIIKILQINEKLAIV
jgi:hypothetical protein